MKAVTWQGTHDVRVDTVPDPSIEHPTDAIIRVTSSGICGSDLHLYEVLGPFIDAGDILGHEPMGVVEEVGSEVDRPRERRPRGDPLQHLLRPLLHVRHGPACPSARPLRCASTTREPRFFGYTKLYGQVPGGQAEFLRVPQAQFGPDQGARGPARRPLRVPLRRAAHGVAGRASTPASPTAASVAGARASGPIGEMSLPDRPAPWRRARHGRRSGARAARLARARTASRPSISNEHDDLRRGGARARPDGRGPTRVIDAVGHGGARGRRSASSRSAWPGFLPGRRGAEGDRDSPASTG